MRLDDGAVGLNDAGEAFVEPGLSRRRVHDRLIEQAYPARCDRVVDLVHHFQIVSAMGDSRRAVNGDTVAPFVLGPHQRGMGDGHGLLAGGQAVQLGEARRYRGLQPRAFGGDGCLRHLLQQSRGQAYRLVLVQRRQEDTKLVATNMAGNAGVAHDPVQAVADHGQNLAADSMAEGEVDAGKTIDPDLQIAAACLSALLQMGVECRAQIALVGHAVPATVRLAILWGGTSRSSPAALSWPFMRPQSSIQW